MVYKAEFRKNQNRSAPTGPELPSRKLLMEAWEVRASSVSPPAPAAMASVGTESSWDSPEQSAFGSPQGRTVCNLIRQHWNRSPPKARWWALHLLAKATVHLGCRERAHPAKGPLQQPISSAPFN